MIGTGKRWKGLVAMVFAAVLAVSSGITGYAETVAAGSDKAVGPERALVQAV
ncbi:MAG: hypothetical protein QM683_22060 [Lacrimispora sp.]